MKFKILLIILITAIVSVLGTYFWQSSTFIKERSENQKMIQQLSERLDAIEEGEVAQKSDKKTFTIEGLTFTMPEDWGSVKVVQETHQKVYGPEITESAVIKVPDPKYNVTMTMDMFKKKSDFSFGVGVTFIMDTPSGAKIYKELCPPGICYYLSYNGMFYEIQFYSESDQPIPENLDGPWFPDTQVTEEEKVNFIATVE